MLLLTGSAWGLDWQGKVDNDLRDLRSPNARVRLQALRRIGDYSRQRATPHILASLEDDDPRVQRLAATMAAERRLGAAIPVLTTWLSHWDQSMRVTAADALGELGATQATRALVRTLSDPEVKVRLATVRALGRITTDDRREVVPLLARLRDTSSKVRQAVVTALAAKGDRRAVIPLMAILDDPSHRVRLEAVTALGTLGDRGAGPALVRQVRDSNRKVAAAAIETLGKLKYAPATEALVDLFKGNHAHREPAAMALASLGSPLAIKTLIAGLRSSSHRVAAQLALTRHADNARQQLVDLLSAPQLGRRALSAAVAVVREARLVDAVPSLVKLLRRGRIPSRDVIEALGEMGDSRVQRPLLELLGHPSPVVRRSALAALRGVIDGRAAEPLLRVLKDPDRDNQVTAVRYLGRLEARIATTALCKLARAPHRGLARASVAALSQIRDRAATRTLVRLLRHRDRTLRRLAAQALSRTRDPAAVPPLVRLCREGAGGVRVTCLQALGGVLRGSTDPRARAALLGVLASSDRSAVLAALDAIAAMDDPRLTEALVQRHAAAPRPMRVKILETLGNHRGEGVDAALKLLLEAIRSEDPIQRAAAAWGLGKLGRREAIGRLRQAARDRSWIVRANAVAALGRLAPRSSTALLRLLARDSVAYVRANAVLALGASRRSGPIVRLLASRVRDRTPWVRVNALRALYRVAGPRARVRLPQRSRPTEVSQLRRTLARRDPDPRVRALLERRDHETNRGDTWIGLYLLDTANKPLRRSLFVLVTPSGWLKASYSDARAEAWEHRLRPGTCYVERPIPGLKSPELPDSAAQRASEN